MIEYKRYIGHFTFDETKNMSTSKNIFFGRNSNKKRGTWQKGTETRSLLVDFREYTLFFGHLAHFRQIYPVKTLLSSQKMSLFIL